MIAIGIDPGLTGAVAAIIRGEPEVWDTPYHPKGKSGRRYNLPVMDEMIRRISSYVTDHEPVLVGLERQQSMPGQGVASTFSTGYGYGVWEALLVAHNLPYEIVGPKVWKKATLQGLPAGDKASSLVAAARLFPTAELGRKKDAGRADALLIAEYTRMKLLGQQPVVMDGMVREAMPV